MTRIRVDADEIVTLGHQLIALADALSAAGDGSVDRWAFGGDPSGDAFEELVGQWRLHRLRLVASLADLGEAALTAGGVYVDTESALAGRLLTGGPQ